MMDIVNSYRMLAYWVRGAWKCIQAQVRWFQSGERYSTSEQLKERLDQCVPCEFRANERCTMCNCPIVEKTMMVSEFCPIDKWKSHE